MMDMINWCNGNQGFLSAVLSVVTIFISILAIRMTHKMGKMPYKKHISIIPFLSGDEDKYFIDVMVVNTGLATVLIRRINITNNDGLVIGDYGKIQPIALRPNDFIRHKIEIYDDIENVMRHKQDLNNHIRITVYGYNNERYVQCKGFPVG